MRCFSASICDSSESNAGFLAPSTGAGFLGAGAPEALLEPFALRLRSASSTACFLATSAAILAWRARARASAASILST